jgi:RNA polymerase sigma factor (sigma-70 family)
MDAGSQASSGEPRQPERTSIAARGGCAPEGSRDWVGVLLGRWQAREVRIAQGFPECRSLAREEIEDLYQETVLRLLEHSYASEEHLRNALRVALRRRALNLHRDKRRRAEILARCAPDIYALAEAGTAAQAPETAALLEQDRSIAAEFMAELDPLEQLVFRRLVDGMRYRAIAAAEGIEPKLARNAAGSIERKRERFQILYDSGRLCGYRASTILALQRGEATSVELATRAFAHLESCPQCRALHRTNARLLRARFERQAAALLPLPVLAGRGGWLSRADMRLRTLGHRLLPEWSALGGGGSVREQAVAIIAGGGVATKLAAGVAAVTVATGSAIGAHLLASSGRHHRAVHRTAVEDRARVALTPTSALSLSAEPVIRPAKPRRHTRSSPHISTPRARIASSRAPQPREPGGFAYLGVPASTHSASTVSSKARSASAASTNQRGGEFSP